MIPLVETTPLSNTRFSIPQSDQKLIRTIQIGTGWFPEKPGGLARVFYDLFHHFDAANIYSRGLVTGSQEVLRATNGQVVAFAKSDDSLLIRWSKVRQAFRELISQEPVDLIVSHFSLYTFPLLPVLKNHPLVIHFHGPWSLESKAEMAPHLAVLSKKYLEAAVYKRGAHFVVLSQAFKDVLHDAYKVPEDRIHIVPGSIDTEAYNTGLTKQAARDKLGWPQDRPILLAVRRLVRRQGLENLVAAMLEVRKEHPNALLFIAGQGAIRAELEAQIERLELSNSVQLLGYVPDEMLATTYRGADFSIVPTVAYEGFGLITIESLAAGTPVLVTPVGGLPEVVKNLSENLILADSSVTALAEGISSTLAGTRSLPNSETCQRYVKAHYDHLQTIQKVRQVYEVALNPQ